MCCVFKKQWEDCFWEYDSENAIWSKFKQIILPAYFKFLRNGNAGMVILEKSFPVISNIIICKEMTVQLERFNFQEGAKMLI